jgi:hypothetical protein
MQHACETLAVMNLQLGPLIAEKKSTTHRTHRTHRKHKKKKKVKIMADTNQPSPPLPATPATSQRSTDKSHLHQSPNPACFPAKSASTLAQVSLSCPMTIAPLPYHPHHTLSGPSIHCCIRLWSSPAPSPIARYPTSYPCPPLLQHPQSSSFKKFKRTWTPP